MPTKKHPKNPPTPVILTSKDCSWDSPWFQTKGQAPFTLPFAPATIKYVQAAHDAVTKGTHTVSVSVHPDDSQEYILHLKPISR